MEYYQIIMEKLLQVAPGAVTAGQDEIRMICPVCKNPKAILLKSASPLPRKAAWIKWGYII